jgi:nicotinate-nucleotide--dimethylbenzimidazole phosphoribosyltransferase
MTRFTQFSELSEACQDLPLGNARAETSAQGRQFILTKPPGSLGRLEELAAWLARWQGRDMPRLDRVEIIVFAGNHGVTAQGVSPYPSAVTGQMVGNFAADGAAINQLAVVAQAELRIVPLLDRPAADFTTTPALDDAAFLQAVSTGYDTVQPGTDLLCLGEMGIGNTTSAAAITAALFGGSGARWAGRGTGIDDAGLARKVAAIDAGVSLHAAILGDPLRVAAALGGYELAAILGATLAARHLGVPLLLDGFVCTAAAAPLAQFTPGALDHAVIAHVSAEAGHRGLAEALGKQPLLDLGMRLGEASGAAVAVLVLRAALACHLGMATFEQAGVTDRA